MSTIPTDKGSADEHSDRVPGPGQAPRRRPTPIPSAQEQPQPGQNSPYKIPPHRARNVATCGLKPLPLPLDVHAGAGTGTAPDAGATGSHGPSSRLEFRLVGRTGDGRVMKYDSVEQAVDWIYDWVGGSGREHPGGDPDGKDKEEGAKDKEDGEDKENRGVKKNEGEK